jgi:hypothetical protein
VYTTQAHASGRGGSNLTVWLAELNHDQLAGVKPLICTALVVALLTPVSGWAGPDIVSKSHGEPSSDRNNIIPDQTLFPCSKAAVSSAAAVIGERPNNSSREVFAFEVWRSR